ncbi:MAG TPA: hypothetical protein VME22_29945 [Solirubrobacteraceae bacterium]|nr:hypothetical protein [Solirubrobacteraceae bacterium]
MGSLRLSHDLPEAARGAARGLHGYIIDQDRRRVLELLLVEHESEPGDQIGDRLPVADLTDLDLG